MKTIKDEIGNDQNRGFTIVELLVVVVLIGIMAAIIFVSYHGITTRANETTLVSDLTNNKKQLELYFAENSSYPISLDAYYCPTNPKVDTNYCLKPSSGNTLTYYGDSDSFTLLATKGAQTVAITNNSVPKALSLAQPANCPVGFIPIPGDSTYGTYGFCVMKYEAKNAGNNIPVSTAAGLPWAVSQANATAYSKNVAGCSGCSLISEAQWMTIAKSALSVGSNWSGGVVGSGFIYSGHNDISPASPLVASTNDNDGYVGTGNTAGSNQRRTLTLANGEVIWDMAGNVWEWTSGQTIGGQPGIVTAGFGWRQWTALTVPGSLAIDPTPAGTGLVGASTWGSAQGVGQLYSDTSDSTLRVFLRGGGWGNTSNRAGLLYLNMSNVPSAENGDDGFRVTNLGF